jgi:hypothetical protein
MASAFMSFTRSCHCRYEKEAPLTAKPKIEKQVRALGDEQLRKLKKQVQEEMPKMLKALQERAVVAATTAQLEVRLNLFCCAACCRILLGMIVYA